MRILAATYAVHGWLAILAILLLLAIVVLGVRTVFEGLARGVRRMTHRG